jgi:hypothetical protein
MLWGSIFLNTMARLVFELLSKILWPWLLALLDSCHHNGSILVLIKSIFLGFGEMENVLGLWWHVDQVFNWRGLEFKENQLG